MSAKEKRECEGMGLKKSEKISLTSTERNKALYNWNFINRLISWPSAVSICIIRLQALNTFVVKSYKIKLWTFELCFKNLIFNHRLILPFFWMFQTRVSGRTADKTYFLIIRKTFKIKCKGGFLSTMSKTPSKVSSPKLYIFLNVKIFGFIFLILFNFSNFLKIFKNFQKIQKIFKIQNLNNCWLLSNQLIAEHRKEYKIH